MLFANTKTYTLSHRGNMAKINESKIREALKTFRIKKVMTVNQLVDLMGNSIPTVRRRLSEWNTHTSYNQNGRYYTLPDIPRFNEHGLWRYRHVYFSKHGNLKQTVIHLINQSEAGLSASELGEILGLPPRSFISHFQQHPGFRREKHHGVFIYMSSDRNVCARQKGGRQVRDVRNYTPAEAIAILVEKIKTPDAPHETICRRLRKRRFKITPDIVETLFAAHGLDLKKTSRSRH